MIKVTIISGSSRKNSNTLRAANAVRLCAEQYTGSQVDLVSFEDYDIPFMNQGSVDRNNLTDFQQRLVDSWAQADMVFIITPEYNWFPSAELVNMLHQIGDVEFRNLFDGKVFATAGVSSGRGGRMPAVQLTYVFNKLIGVLNTTSIVSGKVFESQFTPKVLSPEGLSLGNTEYDKGLEAFVQYNLKLAQRWNSGKPLTA